MTTRRFKAFGILFAAVLVGLFLNACSYVAEKSAAFGTVSTPTPKAPKTITPHNITLLLPTTNGSLASSGKAISDGFLAAYYADHEAHKNKNLDINVVDTSVNPANKSATDFYNDSLMQGADIVVGPLTKQDVANLKARNDFPIPVLALNTLDNYQKQKSPNFYQFGLSPQDEVIQAADKINADNHKRIAILAPDTPWGQKLVGAFVTQFEHDGGQVVANMGYTETANLSTEIKSFLEVNGSEHRTDIDAFFLIAMPKEGRQIVPLLKYYFASELPQIYAISTIYSGSPNPSLDQDLNGVMFCDVPWVITNVDSLPKRIQNIRTKIATLSQNASKNNARLYALGADAYNIIAYFNDLTNSKSAKIRGATGILNIDEYNHVYRTLSWTTFAEGAPVLQNAQL